MTGRDSGYLAPARDGLGAGVSLTAQEKADLEASGREKYRVEHGPLARSGVLEGTDKDPAPDIQAGPEHPLAQVLRDRLAERAPEVAAQPEMAQVDSYSAFHLGYETCIYDLVQATSEPTRSVKLMTFNDPQKENG